MFLFFICLFSFLLVLSASLSGVFEVCLDRCSLFSSDVLFMLDPVSLFCLLMLFLCGAPALVFCNHYFGVFTLEARGLYHMLIIFLGVMGVLITTYSVLGTLVMWEYLGVVSFFLILFYGNLDSLRATLITVFASRFGDVCLFGLLLFLWAWQGGGPLFSFLLLLIVITKSACFPFISWLLEAMRAPTPVSSLVHSSTLVAAGVWFLFRYGNGVLLFSDGLESVFFVLCLSSVLISSFCALVFLDLKKIVALSTCNNVSWCIIFFLFGDVFLALFQLLGHGVAKCYLFISLGDLMSSSSSSQDSRGVYNSSCFGGVSLFPQAVLVLSLSGVPFLGVFFSKHALLGEVVWSYNIICYVFLFFAFLMSYVYSFRLLSLLCGFKSLMVYSYGSFFLITFLSSLVSALLGFFGVWGMEEFYLVGSFSSLLLVFVQLVGFISGLWFYFESAGGGFLLSGAFVWGCESFVALFYSVFDCCYRLFLFLLYRWEAGSVFYFFCYLFGVGEIIGSGWRSLKFLMLSGFFVIGLCLGFC